MTSPLTISFSPRYQLAEQSGLLETTVLELEQMLKACTVCPRDCLNDRMRDEIAACYSGSLPIVSSHTPHFGEEPFLSGTHGAGNIFFGNCNLRCVYCQNHQISQTWKEQKRNEVSHERLAEMILELQGRGCHNIGFVSPTHFAPQMARGVMLAHRLGLRLPIVYNTNAYDSVDVLKHLEQVVDIYLPDLKYSDNENGFVYSKVRSYREVSRNAIREMHRQTGSGLVFGEDGLLKRGLVIRLLVLPNDIAGLEESLEWIASELGSDVCISLMAQYYPTNKAGTDQRYILMSRRIGESEWIRAIELVERFGFTNGFVQEYESAAYYYRPDFNDSETPFKDIRDFS